MIVVTWNVLHRIHAENYQEEVADRFPDEAARIAAVTRRVVAALAEPDVVVCLQEVSGDQLASLLDAARGYVVRSFVYPRVPSPHRGRAPAPSPLRQPHEHLVTLARRADARAAESFADDPGKGFLAVDVDGMLVVNTHVSFGDRRAAQLARLARVTDGPCVVCGDFNAGADAVRAGLGPGFSVVDLGPDALPTRPRRVAVEGKPAAIDHVVTRGLVGHSGVVLDVAGESDHNMVRAVIDARATSDR